MALTYRNALKGHVVSVPEPADIMAAAQAEAEKFFREGTVDGRRRAEIVMDKARSRALHQRQTLVKMDESRRWERYTAPPVVAPPAPVVEPVAVAEPVVAPIVTPEPESVEAQAKATKATPKPVKAEA